MFILYILSFLLLGVLGKDKRPNILFILADDLGYNELGYGNTSRGLLTPNIDALATSGVELSNYYVLPICSPTRSALMTGRYSLRLGTQANVIYWDTPWGVSLSETFISDYLQQSGYRTALFGKWHLGMHANEYAPWSRGFDVHEGYLQGCESAYTHISACCSAGSPSHDQNYTCPAHETQYRGYDWFSNGGTPDFSASGTNSVHLITDATERFLHSQSQDQPFFLYLPFQNIHGPYTSDPKYFDMYKNRTDLKTEEKAIFGYITELDDAIGKVLQNIRDGGFYDDTVIIFSSDNGAPNPHNVRWRNYPYRGFKGEVWEGGTKVRGFVHSPMFPKKVQGNKMSGLMHVVDWLPTVLDIAGINPKVHPKLDGVSQWDQITGQNQTFPRSSMVYNMNPLCNDGQAGRPKAAVRLGKYKLLHECYNVEGIDGSKNTGPFNPDGKGPYLFDLEKDPGEANNIAKQNPDVVGDLERLMHEYASEMVQPMVWEKPYQGPDYYCSNCPKRNHTGPLQAWTPWITL